MSADLDPEETAVPEDARSPRCPYCDRPFHAERLRTLHLGLEHYDRLDDDDREAFDAAYLEETDEIRVFRLKLLVGLVALYFGLLLVYAVVT